MLTACGDSAARAWDTKTGQLLASPWKHGSDCLRAILSPDRRYVVTLGRNGSIRLWDTITQRLVHTKLNQEAPVHTLLFSPDARWIAIGISPNKVKLWEISTDSESEFIITSTHDAQARGMQEPSDRGQNFGAADAPPRIWDDVLLSSIGLIQSSEKPGMQPSPERKPGMGQPGMGTPGLGQPALDSVKPTRAAFDARDVAELLESRVEICFSHDASLLSVAAAERVQIWEMPTRGRPLKRLPMEFRGNHVALSPDGSHIITTDANSAILSSMGGAQSVWLSHSEPVCHASFSKDGQFVVTGSLDSTARVWHAATGLPRTPPLKHSGPVHIAVFSDDGRRLLTSSLDMTARVWDTVTGEPVAPPFRHNGRITNAEFSPDSSRVLTSSRESTARLWYLPPPDMRPSTDLVLLTTLNSGWTIDTGRLGLRIPLTARPGGPEGRRA